MALELIIIGGIVVLAIIFLWGGKKLPDLARQAGRMTKEVQQAYREGASSAHPSEQSAVSDLLTETAKRMGIRTEGKTKEEISEEMVKKARSSSQS